MKKKKKQAKTKTQKARKKQSEITETEELRVDEMVPASEAERRLNSDDEVDAALIQHLKQLRVLLAQTLVEKQKDLDTPLSESLLTCPRLPKDIQHRMTAWHCIALLRAMAENEPKKKISRNYFRNHSGLSESTWNRFFGTFNQFKRSAGVLLSREAHRLSLQIARHAGTDQYAKIEEQRERFTTKYERPSGKRFQTMLVGADFHDKETDAFAWRVFLDTALRAQPEIICLAGDFYDLYEFSKYTQDPREFDPVGRLQMGHEMLKWLREVAPNAQIDLIEGNHEMRLLRHLADATPAMLAVLSDLHGFNVPRLLGLDEFELNYIGRASLKARSFSESSHKQELKRNWKVYFDCVLAHHFPTGRNRGMPGFHGHHHVHQVWTTFAYNYGGPHEWHQIGAMCNRISTYTDGEKWTNGFLLVHIDTEKKIPMFEYVPITDFAVVGGEYYYRTEDEVPWLD